MEKNTRKIKVNKLLKAQIIAIFISIILGLILHFLYQLTGENKIIASISAVNESVWEHLKLVFYPMMLVGVIEYIFIKNISNNYLEAKTIGIFTSIFFIVVTFFTYTGIIGKNFLLLDILIFIISIILGEGVAYKLMIRKSESNIKTKILAGGILTFLLSCFIIFTYYPPKANIFKDTSKGIYITKKSQINKDI